MKPDFHVWVCVPCRLLPGLNLDDFCYKVRKATGRLRTKEQLVEVRQWMWDFTMHAMYLLVQVSLHAVTALILHLMYLFIALFDDPLTGFLTAAN